MDQEFDKALGLGEDFPLRSGETIQVFPARLVDLKEANKLYDKMIQIAFPALFFPGNEDAFKTFGDLLLMATNQSELRNAEEAKWESAVAEILTKFGRIDDGGAEVRQFIWRFLGIVPRNSAPAADNEQ